MFRQNHVVDNPFFFVYNIYIYKPPTKIEPKSNQVGYIPLFTHLKFPLSFITSLAYYPIFGHIVDTCGVSQFWTYPSYFWFSPGVAVPNKIAGAILQYL